MLVSILHILNYIILNYNKYIKISDTDRSTDKHKGERE